VLRAGLIDYQTKHVIHIVVAEMEDSFLFQQGQRCLLVETRKAETILDQIFLVMTRGEDQLNLSEHIRKSRDFIKNRQSYYLKLFYFLIDGNSQP